MELRQEKGEGEIQTLPKELWVIIASFLSRADSVKEAVRDIKSLSSTNKALYNFLKSPVNLNNLIKKIAQRFNTDEITVEILFGTPRIKEWFANTIKRFKENIDERAEIMKSIINNNNTALLSYIIDNIDENIDINSIYITKYDKLYSPLEFAISQNKPDIVSILINKGHADVSMSHINNETPLIRALESRYFQGAEDVAKIATLLLDKGAIVTDKALSVAHDSTLLSDLLNKYKNRTVLEN